MEIRTVAQFLEYWDSLRGRTRRVVACIPPDRLEWAYRPGKFTLGDLVRHLATIERYMYAETVAGRPSRYAGCGRDLADGYDAVLACFDRLDQESRAIIGGLSDADLGRKCQTPAGDVRARGASSRTDLSHARYAGGRHATFVWVDVRGSARSI
jgi:hypothetical protein